MSSFRVASFIRSRRRNIRTEHTINVFKTTSFFALSSFYCRKSSEVKRLYYVIQECNPVGCVPSAAVAVTGSWGCLPRGCLSRLGVCPGGVSAWGVSAWGVSAWGYLPGGCLSGKGVSLGGLPRGVCAKGLFAWEEGCLRGKGGVCLGKCLPQWGV